MVLKGKTIPAKKRRNLYTSSSKYRNWPRLGLGAVGLRSLGLADLGAGLCKRNSVLNILGPSSLIIYSTNMVVGYSVRSTCRKPV